MTSGDNTPSNIAKLVDALDAPDPRRRQKARQQLLNAGSSAVDTLAANLPLVDRSQQFDLLEIVAEIGDNAALEPLTDFFRSHRDKPGNADLRVETLDAILSVANDRDVDAVFDFLVDIHSDPAPEVRRRAIEGFAIAAGDRARPFIEKALNDDAPSVRETARSVEQSLDAGEVDTLGESTLSDRQLVGRLKNRAGSQLEYYRRELLSRDNAFELARALLEGDDAVPMRAFRLMHSIDDPRVRAVATHWATPGTDSGPRAAALRLLADRATGELSDDELDAIRTGLRARDPYVELAAIEAAGASGDSELMTRAIRATVDPDEELAVTASDALSRGLSPEHGDLLDDLLNALRRVRERRRDDATPDRIKTEAYLLRALRRAATQQSPHADDIVEEALESLRDAENHKPILVTGLTLLSKLLSASNHDLSALHSLSSHPDTAVRQRAESLLNSLDVD